MWELSIPENFFDPHAIGESEFGRALSSFIQVVHALTTRLES